MMSDRKCHDVIQSVIMNLPKDSYISKFKISGSKRLMTEYDTLKEGDFCDEDLQVRNLCKCLSTEIFLYFCNILLFTQYIVYGNDMNHFRKWKLIPLIENNNLI